MWKPQISFIICSMLIKYQVFCGVLANQARQQCAS